MLLKKANTITTPTAYSNGFLHSVKPEVVENLLLQSNQFDTTWATTSSSVTSGQSGYDGSTDAWLLQTTASGGRVIQSISVSGVSTYSIYAKSGNVNWVALYAAGSPVPYVFFDLQNGVVGTSFGGNTIDEKITSVGNGWYRCSITANSSITEVRVFVATADNTLSAASGDNIYIQDAQLNKGLTAYPYLETTTEAKPSADFSFSRNSSATRVNELGYIEDVQIIGGELVSNGDFEEIGSEEVTNGDFSDATNNWENPIYGSDNSADLSIFDGALKIEKTADLDWRSSFVRQYPISYTNGKIYRVKYSLKDGNTSGADVYIRSNFDRSASQIAIKALTSDWVEYTDYYVADSSAEDISFGVLDWQNTGTGQYYFVDNVSVKEVGQDWSFGTSWNIINDDGNLKAKSDGSIDSALQQLNVIENAKKYRLTFDISDRTTGEVQIRFGNPANVDLTINQNQSYSYDLISDGTTLYFRSVGSFNGSIDNISVKEVTNDTNLPRINYEGFTYAESLGDNLVVNGTFDTDSNWTLETGWSISGGVASCDGTTGNLQQFNVLTTEKYYKAKVTVSNMTTGALSYRLGANASDEVINITDNGTYTAYGIAGSGTVRLRSQSGFDGSVDNVSVQEVIGNLPVPYSGKGHLLLEPQRTNLVTYSEDFESSDWSKTNITIDNNISISPDGNVNASRVNSTTTAQTSYAIFNSSNVSGALSYFAKDSGGRYFVVIRGPYANNDYAIFDLENGVISKNPTYSGSTAEIENYGNGWYRCILYSAQLATVNAFSTSGSGTALDVLASGTIDIYGAQMEVGDYATSYIPTLNGTTVTRLGETCNNATQSFPSEGVLYAEIAALANDGSLRRIYISDGSSSDRIMISYNTGSNFIRCFVIAGGVISCDFQTALTNILDFHKIAIRYKENDFSLWIDGEQLATDVSGSVPTGLNDLAFDALGLYNFYGKTKMVATFPYLSNDEMECLTGEGYGTFEALAAAYSYTII